jgi:hypothetical protein
MADQEYKVGYRRPPKSGQFKKGESGNPNGRPKGSRGLEKVVLDELKTKITVNENGRSKRVKKIEVIAKQVVNKAVTGDSKSIALLIGVSQRHEEKLAAKASPLIETLPEEDKQVMESLMERMQAQFNADKGGA